MTLVLGALAQLGERHAGSVEVTGSSPVCSTNDYSKLLSIFYKIPIK